MKNIIIQRLKYALWLLVKYYVGYRLKRFWCRYVHAGRYLRLPRRPLYLINAYTYPMVCDRCGQIQYVEHE